MNKSYLHEIVQEIYIKNLIEEINGAASENEITDIDKYMIRTSTKTDSGIEDLLHAVREMFFHGEISYNDQVYITNMRHKEAIREALESMMQVRKSLEMEMPEDFYSIDLMSAYASLGSIIGEEVGDDLVNEIFSKFCMGK